MGTYLVIRQLDGRVVNAFVAECENSVPAPDGHIVVAPSGEAWIGWTLNGDSTWTPPPPESA